MAHPIAIYTPISVSLIPVGQEIKRYYNDYPVSKFLGLNEIKIYASFGSILTGLLVCFLTLSTCVGAYLVDEAAP